MPDTKPVHDCPICGSHTYVQHCDSGKCGWMRCRNDECDAVIDAKKGRGHAINPDGLNSAARRLVAIA